MESGEVRRVTVSVGVGTWESLKRYARLWGVSVHVVLNDALLDLLEELRKGVDPRTACGEVTSGERKRVAVLLYGDAYAGAREVSERAGIRLGTLVECAADRLLKTVVL